jgi:uncharacterized metal-binding protein YceD (DUF177 family)
MTAAKDTRSGPASLSQPCVIDDLPAGGADITVEASATEREALAREFGLPAIARLTGRFHVEPRRRGARVTGSVEADVTQVCVVTLEEFAAHVVEAVDLAFSSEPAPRRAHEIPLGEIDVTLEGDEPPELIEDGAIDLGAVTAEFLALGLDPWPRKPGAAFDAPDEVEQEAAPSPFAALQKLRTTD